MGGSEDDGEGVRHMPNADSFASVNHRLEWLKPSSKRKGMPRHPEKSRKNAEVFALLLPLGHSAMANGRCRMHGGCQYRTAHPRRAGAVEMCSLKTWALFRGGPSGAKACARPAGPKSRALETDASRLNARRHGAWGSSAVLSAAEGSLRPESSVLTDSDRRDLAW
jgi:hypothetical protein